jgi:hypothetical protein
VHQKRAEMIDAGTQVWHTEWEIVVVGQPAMRRRLVAVPGPGTLASAVEKRSGALLVLCVDTLEHKLRKIAARHIRWDA